MEGNNKVVALRRRPKQVGKSRKHIQNDNSNKLKYGWRETNEVVPLKRCPEIKWQRKRRPVEKIPTRLEYG